MLPDDTVSLILTDSGLLIRPEYTCEIDETADVRIVSVSRSYTPSRAAPKRTYRQIRDAYLRRSRG